MEKNNERLRQIKSELNEKIKLVKIEFKGIKTDEKLVNIAKILKKYGNENLMPDVEQYYLFDFERIKDEIKIYAKNNYEKLKEAEKYQKIYDEYKKFIDSMKTIEKALRNHYVIDSLGGVSLVYKDELSNIEDLSKTIQEEQRELNIDDMNNMLIYCSECLKTTIFYELNQRNITETTEEMNKEINQKIKNISSYKDTIGSVGIKYDFVFDISEEMLNDKDIIINLKRRITDEKSKELLDEYYSIKHKSL